ncbi:Pimeloyl-[acyl-carrier protein] methyl ester esterase [Phycisphaerales bacterium]|nr:Pimeloyl-[acyl-carrier protein] methyl ester esterase [Phycisphaerales bacterium]
MTAEPDSTRLRTHGSSRRGGARRWLAVAYVLLLAASAAWRWNLPDHEASHDDTHAAANIGRWGNNGRLGEATARLAYREWRPAGNAPTTLPRVLLLHGSPGDGSNFARVGPEIARSGYHVLAPDLPGFGDSQGCAGSLSMLAQARAMLEFMGEGRFHVVGWSNGGGVALHMADLAPDKIASLTLLGSIGVQEDEGSGSYYFEHFKYSVAFALVGGAPELLPHFGLLGSFRERTAWVRNFWESDQRPLREVMAQVEAPTLILHGSRDFLVPARTAEHSHAIMKSSRLVLLPASHFMPFMQAEESARYLREHFARHDEPGVAARTDRLDLSRPRVLKGRMDRWLERTREGVRATPWWAQIAGIAVLMLLSLGWMVVVTGLLVVGLDMDWSVALVGLFAGFALQQAGLWAIGALRSRGVMIPAREKALRTSRADWLRRLQRGALGEGFGSQFVSAMRVGGAFGLGLARAGWWASARFVAGRCLGIGVWVLSSFLAVVLAEVLLVGGIRERFGLPGVAYTLVKLILVAELAPMLITRRGRQHLLAILQRIIHYEYWPMWAFYIPLGPYLAYLAWKHGGFTTFTCCNPGIENGGGVVGESKSKITDALPREPGVLAMRLIAPGEPQARVRTLAEIMARDRAITFPLILKPDVGQRGFAVRLVHSHDDALRYFQEMAAPAVAQAYAAGPLECGVCWVRRVPPGSDGNEGFIYSVTRKEFPLIVGDGARTLEELILAHPRFKRQAGVFLERFAEQASRVLEAGETLRLAQSGNHCQGTLFRDGADLITPDLSATIDRLSRGFRGGLDVGRFDIRYESDAALRRGEGFQIVELNGVTGESTNLYDPSKSLRWAYRVLFGQWRLLFELGAWRRSQGARPMTPGGLWRAWREHGRARSGRALAD